jgi:chemotaxis protein methyltransferase CheR
MPSNLIVEGFDVRGHLLCVRNRFRQGVTFSKQDIRHLMPTGPFDLILCRNLAFTYFEASEQQRMLASFTARLRTGGYLVIGTREAIPEGNDAFCFIPEYEQIFRYDDGCST